MSMQGELLPSRSGKNSQPFSREDYGWKRRGEEAEEEVRAVHPDCPRVVNR